MAGTRARCWLGQVLLYCFCKYIGCITTVGGKHGEPPYRLKFTEDVKHEVVRLKD